MTSPVDDAERRLERLFGLSPAGARRAVQETLDCFRMEVDEYIVARHGQLRNSGVTNEAAYEQISAELRELRFTAPSLTIRQVRRRIYG